MPTALALLAFRLAGEAPPPNLSGDTAVQVALIGALAPIVAVIVNEIVQRTRRVRTTRAAAAGEPPAPDEGRVLAPMEEVPREQYDALLSRVVALDELAASRERSHESSLASYRERAERAEADEDRVRRESDGELERLRDRYEAELARLRERQEEELGRVRARLEDEMRGRIRAETMLAGFQGGGGHDAGRRR